MAGVGVGVDSPDHAEEDIHHYCGEFLTQSPVGVSLGKRATQAHVDQEQREITNPADGPYYQPPGRPRFLRSKKGDNIKDDVRAEKNDEDNGLYAG